MANFEKFRAIAENPRAQMDKYLASGKKVVLTAPVYTPGEIIHAMGLVPMGAWGADVQIQAAKKYFPAFICSILQSALELGITGKYDGASAIVIPSLCDSLKTMGQNWKYAVPGIPFIPMTYPQNRFGSVGTAFTRAGYERVIRDLESVTGAKFCPDALSDSIKVYNRHNKAMRAFVVAAAEHNVSAADRSAVFKSAFFTLPEEHTAMVEELIASLGEPEKAKSGRIMTCGILADSPSLLAAIDKTGMRIVCDDIAAESRQYRTDAPETGDSLDALARKFADTGCCSVLYDPKKTRAAYIVECAKAASAGGVVIVMTKFCDPEEFDYPIVKKALDAAGIPSILIETDRQMVNYAQAETMLDAFRDVIA